MNEQKWRLRGTGIVGIKGWENVDGTTRFRPDGWPYECWMYLTPDMLEPADVSEGMIDDLQRTVDKLFRNYPWLRDVLAALPKENEPEPSLWQRIAATDRRVLALELAPDLGQRVKALEAALANDNKRLTVLDVWRDAHQKVQGRDLAAINRRLDALDERFTAMNALQQSTSGLVNSVATMLAAAPAPDQPLQVGDEVWVRGKLTYLDLLSTDRRPFGINFGNDDRFWFRKDTEIKRA